MNRHRGDEVPDNSEEEAAAAYHRFARHYVIRANATAAALEVTGQAPAAASLPMWDRLPVDVQERWVEAVGPLAQRLAQQAAALREPGEALAKLKTSRDVAWRRIAAIDEALGGVQGSIVDALTSGGLPPGLVAAIARLQDALSAPHAQGTDTP